MPVLDYKASYYKVDGISLQDILLAKLTTEQRLGFLLGNFIKYSCRLSHKGSAVSNARKLAIYSTTLADLLGDKR